MPGRTLAVFLATVGLALALSDLAQANGQQFFRPADGKTVNLAYFGRIRDKHTGRPIRQQAFFTIFENSSGMSFPFLNDSAAHYRSPDVGAAVKELGGKKVDPKDLEIQVMVAGYKDVRLTTLPRTTHGLVELDFALEPTDSSALPAADSTPGSTQPLPEQSPLAQPLAYGSVGLFVVAGAVNLLRRRGASD
jgi:hypothetical protein